MAANLGDQREWAAPFALGPGPGPGPAREEPPPPPENPEWEKARQALASISKAAAGGGSKGAASAGGAQYPPAQGDPSLQQAQPPQYYQWYQPYGGGYYPYGYYYPVGVYPGYGAPTAPYAAGGGGSYAAAPQQPPAPPQQQSGLAQQPPVPGLDEASPYGSPQPPPSAPPQPPPHSLGGAGGSAGAGGAAGTPPSTNPPYPSPHGYGEGPPPKGKKGGGGQLWSRMKQAPGAGGLKFQLPKRPFVLPPPAFGEQQRGGGGFGGPPGPEKHHGHGGKPEDWPPEMKAYVQRCFTACESEEDKDRTEKLLKELLQARLQDGSAFTIDWSREPLPGLGRDGAGSPKKKRWELPPPTRPSPAPAPGGPQPPPQRPAGSGGTPLVRGGVPGGARARGGPFPTKFGNRNVFMKENSSSSSGSRSRSRSSSRSPGRHCRRSDSDSDTSGSGAEARPGGRRGGPPKPRSRGGALERGRARAQRGKRPEPGPPRRARRRPPPDPEDPERELRRQRRAQRFQGAAGGGGTPQKAPPGPARPRPGALRPRPRRGARLGPGEDFGHLPGGHQEVPAAHLCPRPGHRAARARAPPGPGPGPIPLGAAPGLRLGLRAAEIPAPGPDRPGRPHRVHGGGLRDPRADRAGEGRPRGVQPVPDAAEGAVRGEPARLRRGVHGLSHPLLHVHPQLGGADHGAGPAAPRPEDRPLCVPRPVPPRRLGLGALEPLLPPARGGPGHGRETHRPVRRAGAPGRPQGHDQGVGGAGGPRGGRGGGKRAGIGQETAWIGGGEG